MDLSIADRPRLLEMARDERNCAGYERKAGGMNGNHRVMRRRFLSGLTGAYLTIAAFLAVVTTFNIFTTLHDVAEQGKSLAIWEAATSEYTSGAATLVACIIVLIAIRMAPPGRTRPSKFILVHASASFAFSGLHVLLMNAMRVGIYAALGRHYPFGESGFLYEYRKDLIAYVVWATIFWLFLHERSILTVASDAPRTIDIRDGKRLLRVPIETITAVRAAGNYVEFMLIDGRRPLARKSLHETHRELGEAAFVRSHRSWLIAPAHVRGLLSVGAGNFEVELGGGTKAPLSRRFPAAIVRLRRGDRPLLNA